MESLQNKLQLLQNMVSPDFDWETCGYDGDIQDLFKECYRWHSYENDGNRPKGTLPCGSAAFDDTPKSLFRLLYLVSPFSVNFSRMYKTGTLIEVCSPEYNFCCSFEFFKYELGAYFHCVPEYHNKKRHQVVAGWPGADNAERCISDIGRLWFETLVKCLNHEYEIYGGNNFVV